jgi:hypothetical protein
LELAEQLLDEHRLSPSPFLQKFEQPVWDVVDTDADGDQPPDIGCAKLSELESGVDWQGQVGRAVVTTGRQHDGEARASETDRAASQDVATCCVELVGVIPNENRESVFRETLHHAEKRAPEVRRHRRAASWNRGAERRLNCVYLFRGESERSKPWLERVDALLGIPVPYAADPSQHRDEAAIRKLATSGWTGAKKSPKIDGAPLETPLHPSQIYESTTEGLLFAFLYWRFGRAHEPGRIIGLYLVLSSVARFAIEFTRHHEQALPFGLPLSITQWIAIGVALLGVYVLRMPTPRQTPTAATA